MPPKPVDTLLMYDIEVVEAFEEALIRFSSSKSKINRDNYYRLKEEILKRMGS